MRSRLFWPCEQCKVNRRYSGGHNCGAKHPNILRPYVTWILVLIAVAMVGVALTPFTGEGWTVAFVPTVALGIMAFVAIMEIDNQ